MSSAQLRTASPGPAQSTDRRSKVRFLIIAMIFIATTLNNADRAALSIVGSSLQKDMGISSITLGYLFASFAWAYMLVQIPGGWLLDRFGSKRVYAWAIFLWSFFTFLQGFVGGFGFASAIVALFVLRIAVGLAEGPAFPSNSRLVATWFPSNERGTAAAIFNSAQYFSAVSFTPLMGWLTHSFGWPWVFFVMGGLGMVTTVAWLFVIHPPATHPMINRAELDYIRDGGALTDMDSKVAGTDTSTGPRVSSWLCIKELLGSRMMLGVYLGQYCITTLVYFFLTWFPIYLVRGLHMNIMQAGFVAAIPAVCGFLGGIMGGVVSDAMLRRGYSLTVSRKVPIVVGMLMAATIGCCTLVSTETAVILFMALAFLGKGIGSLGWAVVADTSPKEAAGLSGGLFNMFANVAGITTPIVIGYIVELTGSFDWALLFVSANAIGAILCFVFITGRIERVTLHHTAALPGAPVSA